MIMCCTGVRKMFIKLAVPCMFTVTCLCSNETLSSIVTVVNLRGRSWGGGA